MALVLNSLNSAVPVLKSMPRKKLPFSRAKNFHQNEPFPLEFVPELGVDHYRAFHTKGIKLSARSF